jgi:succinate--hydroxymethylglutarate CoA-transferase
MAKYALDYATLSRLNPRLVYCSITGYGSTGPYARDPGFDVIAEAVGGFMGITGPKGIGQEPCKAGVAVTNLMTGLFAHGAILAALLNRERTGRGQKIECNLLSTQLAALTNVASNFLNVGMEGRAMGTEHESIGGCMASAQKGSLTSCSQGTDDKF